MWFLYRYSKGSKVHSWPGNVAPLWSLLCSQPSFLTALFLSGPTSTHSVDVPFHLVLSSCEVSRQHYSAQNTSYTFMEMVSRAFYSCQVTTHLFSLDLQFDKTHTCSAHKHRNSTSSSTVLILGSTSFCSGRNLLCEIKKGQRKTPEWAAVAHFKSWENAMVSNIHRKCSLPALQWDYYS